MNQQQTSERLIYSAGNTTTWRSSPAPSLEVRTPGSSFKTKCRMRRSRAAMALNRNGDMSFANAFGGDARGKFQFFDAKGAVAAGIEADAAIKLRIEPKPAERNVFERLEQFGVALEQQILIAAPKNDEDFRIFELRRAAGPVVRISYESSKRALRSSVSMQRRSSAVVAA